MTNGLEVVSVRLPKGDLRRIPVRNRSIFIRDAVAEKLERLERPAWKPKTALGRKLAALRKSYIAAGGELLDADGIEVERRERRGGLA